MLESSIKVAERKLPSIGLMRLAGLVRLVGLMCGGYLCHMQARQRAKSVALESHLSYRVFRKGWPLPLRLQTHLPTPPKIMWQRQVMLPTHRKPTTHVYKSNCSPNSALLRPIEIGPSPISIRTQLKF